MSDDEDLFDRELEGHELDILISLTRGEEDGEDEDVPERPRALMQPDRDGLDHVRPSRMSQRLQKWLAFTQWAGNRHTTFLKSHSSGARVSIHIPGNDEIMDSSTAWNAVWERSPEGMSVWDHRKSLLRAVETTPRPGPGVIKRYISGLDQDFLRSYPPLVHKDMCKQYDVSALFADPENTMLPHALGLYQRLRVSGYDPLSIVIVDLPFFSQLVGEEGSLQCRTPGGCTFSGMTRSWKDYLSWEPLMKHNEETDSRSAPWPTSDAEVLTMRGTCQDCLARHRAYSAAQQLDVSYPVAGPGDPQGLGLAASSCWSIMSQVLFSGGSRQSPVAYLRVLHAGLADVLAMMERGARRAEEQDASGITGKVVYDTISGHTGWSFQHKGQDGSTRCLYVDVIASTSYLQLSWPSYPPLALMRQEVPAKYKLSADHVPDGQPWFDDGKLIRSGDDIVAVLCRPGKRIVLFDGSHWLARAGKPQPWSVDMGQILCVDEDCGNLVKLIDRRLRLKPDIPQWLADHTAAHDTITRRPAGHLADNTFSCRQNPISYYWRLRNAAKMGAELARDASDDVPLEQTGPRATLCEDWKRTVQLGNLLQVRLAKDTVTILNNLIAYHPHLCTLSDLTRLLEQHSGYREALSLGIEKTKGAARDMHNLMSNLGWHCRSPSHICVMGGDQERLVPALLRGRMTNSSIHECDICKNLRVVCLMEAGLRHDDLPPPKIGFMKEFARCVLRKDCTSFYQTSYAASSYHYLLAYQASPGSRRQAECTLIAQHPAAWIAATALRLLHVVHERHPCCPMTGEALQVDVTDLALGYTIDGRKLSNACNEHDHVQTNPLDTNRGLTSSRLNRAVICADIFRASRPHATLDDFRDTILGIAGLSHAKLHVPQYLSDHWDSLRVQHGSAPNYSSDRDAYQQYWGVVLRKFRGSPAWARFESETTLTSQGKCQDPISLRWIPASQVMVDHDAVTGSLRALLERRTNLSLVVGALMPACGETPTSPALRARVDATWQHASRDPASRTHAQVAWMRHLMTDSDLRDDIDLFAAQMKDDLQERMHLLINNDAEHRFSGVYDDLGIIDWGLATRVGKHLECMKEDDLEAVFTYTVPRVAVHAEGPARYNLSTASAEE